VDDTIVTSVDVSDLDIRSMCEQMASAMVELPFIKNSTQPVKIGFLSIENRTDIVDFDSYALLSKIRQQLITYAPDKFAFLDDKSMEAVLAERDRKRSGMATSSIRQDLPGVDYFLTGYAYATRKVGDGGVMEAYYRYSFRLTAAETDEVKWEKDYEFKKYGQRGTVYQGR